MSDVASLWVTVRMSPELARAARKVAIEEGYRGRSHLLRTLFEQHLDERENGTPPRGAQPVEAVSASSS